MTKDQRRRRRDKTTKGVSEDRDFCPIVDKRATAADNVGGFGVAVDVVSRQLTNLRKQQQQQQAESSGNAQSPSTVSSRPSRVTRPPPACECDDDDDKETICWPQFPLISTNPSFSGGHADGRTRDEGGRRIGSRPPDVNGGRAGGPASRQAGFLLDALR